MLAIPVPKPLFFGPLFSTVTAPTVLLIVAPLVLARPNVYLPPSDNPGVKYQSKPKFSPAPKTLPDVSYLPVVVPLVQSVVPDCEAKLIFKPKYGETGYIDLKCMFASTDTPIVVVEVFCVLGAPVHWNSFVPDPNVTPPPREMLGET